MTHSGNETATRLVEDVAAELFGRDPAFVGRFAIELPDETVIARRLREQGYDPAVLLPEIAAGRAGLAARGVSFTSGDGDPVGLMVADSLIDAALAAAGRLPLLPEPRESRSVEQLLAEDFEVTALPSGRRIYVARRSGLPLLVLNALGVPISMSRPLMSDRAGPFRPIFVENRCGDVLTGGMKSDAPLTEHAAELVEALTLVGIDRVHVLAWCNAGRIAIDLARRAPERVAAIVMLSTTLRGTAGVARRPCPYEDNLETAFRRIRARPDFAAPLSRMLCQLFDPVDWSTAPADPEARSAMFLARARGTLARDLAAPMSSGEYLLAYAARTAADEGYPLREALQALTCPLLLVTGDRDAVVSNPSTIEAARLASRFHTVAVTGAGHYVQDLQYRYLRFLISRFVADPDRPDFSGPFRLADATALEPPEWRYRSGQTGRDGERYPLSRLFAYAAATRPAKTALFDGSVSLSFAALERGAERLAGRLLAAGVPPGGHVLVLAEKRSVMPVIAGAIWKADAVYVPVDAESPSDRLGGLIGQVAPAAILGSTEALDRLAAAGLAPEVPVFSFDQILALAEAAVDDGPAVPPLPVPAADEDRTAYIIFTSGSTGTPKGVMISHRSLLDYFYNHNQVLRFTGRSRVFSLAPFHFDVSIEDTLLPLSLGAFVYQFRGVPIGQLMRRLLQRERISHLIAVSSLLALITGNGAEVGPDTLPDLSMVMTGAEVCDPRLIDLWVERMPGVRVINAYGPTEATIVCLTYTVERPEPERTSSYPIGHPLPGVTALIVDAEDRPVTEPGPEGELLIGGTQVMLGYLNRPEETARACPVIDGVRYYRTGDLCRLDAQGRIEFVGRNDDMVKIAGRRIHLGEIRHQAQAVPGVLRAAVGTIDVNGRPAIGLVVVQAVPDVPTADSVREALARQLPTYMLPAGIGTTPEARITSTGKTDERTLLALLADRIRRHGAGDGPLDLLIEATIGSET